MMLSRLSVPLFARGTVLESEYFYSEATTERANARGPMNKEDA